MTYLPTCPPPRPLTRRTRDGVLYVREPAVTTQIMVTATLSPAALLARAGIGNYHDPGFLREECLVYWLREYHRQQDRWLVSDLAAVLLRRAAGHVYHRLRALQADNVEDCYGDVVAALFAPILDLQSDRGDFAQVRFWRFLDAVTMMARRRHLRIQQHTGGMRGWADHRESGGPAGDTDPLHQGSAALEGLSVEQRVLYRDALARLPEPYRRTFVLRHYYGWPIEDADPLAPTISRVFGKTPRTIRNWLATADNLLQEWREEKR
ncbi:MAG TPA: sigma factor-like helix-turn-helix DNA-binding protein [Chloroflexia bacterium]|nr:sigma factor-like helix-turn-helix DNA-binding protein [Chloroflexia bacterium]